MIILLTIKAAFALAAVFSVIRELASRYRVLFLLEVGELQHAFLSPLLRKVGLHVTTCQLSGLDATVLRTRIHRVA
eukprot:1153770-Pelagomonas_calceolata.AAC.2